jgi:UDP-glucose 4-epimerase
MRVLVTGGAGFIGSNLVDRLIARGDHVTVLDDLSRGRLENLACATAAGADRLSVITADILDPGVDEMIALARPSVIFHLAAQIDVRASVIEPRRDADINVLGTVTVAEAARRAGVHKIVFASSGGSIYGDGAALPVSETAAVEPLSPYAVSKVAGELYLNAFSRLHGLQCTHLAFANVYGPRQDPHGEAGVVAIFARAMLSGLPTTVYGDGGNTRDYVYVGDVVRALTMAARPIGDRRRFNIGTGVQTSDRELHALVAEAVGCPDDPLSAPQRPGDLRHSALDASSAGAVLDWYPEHDLADGIALTVAHFRDQLVAQ